MKRGNKKGQFYLLAAMIIVILIAGFAAVNNYATKRTSTQIYDIGDELNIEISKVYDYGTATDQTIDTIIDDFTSQYDQYAGEGKEIYFIYGKSTSRGYNISLITYDIEIVNSIKVVGASGNLIEASIRDEVVVKEPLEPDCTNVDGTCTVAVEIKGDTYEFELNPGENFYFIVSQTTGDEQVVVQG